MEWFKVYADIQNHPKRYEFEAQAETEYGLQYLTAWFCYVCKYASDGNVTKFTPALVARACEWRGDPQKFWDALLGAGFIEEQGDELHAHDWAHEHVRFINENSKRKKPKGYPRVTQGLPALEEKRREEKEEKKALTADAVPEEDSFAIGRKRQAKEVRDYWHSEFEKLFKRKAAYIPAKWLGEVEVSLIAQLGKEEIMRRVDNNLRDGYITSPTYHHFLKANEDFATLREKRVQGPRGEYDNKRGKVPPPPRVLGEFNLPKF